MNELANLFVLVTRPDPYGSLLCQQIIAAGGDALHYPTIAFAPPQDAARFMDDVKKLENYEWLIFISPQAVMASSPYLSAVMKDSVKIACVGEATAELLKQQGFTQIFLPSQEVSSEGLLNLTAFASVKEKSMAIIRGEGGREMIDRVLKERGAKVTTVIAYRRVLPDVSSALQAVFEKRVLQHQINVIIGTSVTAMLNLKLLANEAIWLSLKKIPAIVMSERIKQESLALGYENIEVSETASESALLLFLAKERNRLCQMKQPR